MQRGYWIRSKPVYATLVWHEQATAHLVIAHGEAGAMAVVKLFQQMHPEQPITVLYAAGEGDGKDYSEILHEVVPEGLQLLPDQAAVLLALQHYLPGATMGLRVYVAGAEQFMWGVAERCAAYGIDKQDIVKELGGTLARSVYCVHCKAITHEVHSNVAACQGCGRMLFVRDHFSQRLGAYMGLMVDAESPGELPPIKEIYP